MRGPQIFVESDGDPRWEQAMDGRSDRQRRGTAPAPTYRSNQSRCQ